jgi:hypothetical protein
LNLAGEGRERAALDTYQLVHAVDEC